MADSEATPETKSGRRYLAWGVAGAGLAAMAGAGFFLWRARSVERPTYALLEYDGDFEVRDYPALLTAETKADGSRERALDTGFTRLADYIFAKSRDGERLAMTAPVLSSPVDGGGWLTRFIMPARFTAETLPTPTPGISITPLPPRRVVAIGFSGAVDDELLAAKEAQLRSWAGAKKFAIAGPAEHAFYNSPMVPPAMRKSEVLLPLV